LLPAIAEAGLSLAAKDISQGGIVGTAAMLAECSGVGIDIDLNAIPKPDGVALERWLLTFPSFGYLLSVKPAHIGKTIARFAERGIAAAAIGSVTNGSCLTIGDGAALETIWDFAERPLIRAPQAQSIVEAVA
jgi:selenophosphate synthetase-related protein